MKNEIKYRLNFNSKYNNYLYQNKENYYNYSLNNFDKVLIDYYALVWLWEKQKFVEKHSEYTYNISLIEDSFFESSYFFESYSFYRNFESNIYILFFKFLLKFKFDLNLLCKNIIMLNFLKFFNRNLMLKFFLYFLNRNEKGYKYIEPAIFKFNKVIKAENINFKDMNIFSILFEAMRYVYDKEMDAKLDKREIYDYYVEWLYDFDFFFSNAIFSRVKRRRYLIKYLIDYNIYNGIKVGIQYNSFTKLLLKFFSNKKLVENISYNSKFFNKKLKEEQEKKNIYGVVIKLHLLPYLRFFLFNKYIFDKYFSIFNLFSNIYFLCNIFLNLLYKTYNFKFVSIINISKLVYLVNSLIKHNYIINNHKVLSILVFIKVKGKKKKINFFCKEKFILQEALTFLFTLLFNIKFSIKNYRFVLINNLNYEKFLIKLSQFNGVKYVLKGSLGLNLNFKLLLDRLCFFIKDIVFINFLKINLIKFFETNLNFVIHKQLYFLLYDFYYRFFDLNLDIDLFLFDGSFDRYKFSLLNSNNIDLSNLKEFNSFYYFRFLNKFFIFFKGILELNFIKISYNILNLLKTYFLIKPYSLKWVDLQLQNLLINGVTLKYKKNYLQFSFPYLFLFNLLKKFKLLIYKNSLLKVVFKSTLIFLNFKDIFSYFYNIYFSLYIYYYKFFDIYLLKNLYYIIKKSCFLTIFLKLKNVNKILNLKKFNNNFFFNFKLLNYNVIKKKTNNNWTNITYLNLLESTDLLTKNLIYHTTRKFDISLEKSLINLGLRLSLNLWHILFNFDLLRKNLIFYDDLIYIVVFKQLEIYGGFNSIQHNFYIYENPYLEFNFLLSRFFLDYMSLELLWYEYIDLYNVTKERQVKEVEIIDTFIFFGIYNECFKWFDYIYFETELNKERKIIAMGQPGEFTDYVDEEFKLYNEVVDYIGPISREDWFSPNTEILLEDDATFIGLK